MKVRLVDHAAPGPYRPVDSLSYARLSEIGSLDEVLAFVGGLHAADPGVRFLCTLDDLNQCCYTSVHAAEDDRIHTPYGQIDFDDPRAVHAHRLASGWPRPRPNCGQGSGPRPPPRCCDVTRRRHSICSNGTHRRSRYPARSTRTDDSRHTIRVASPGCSPHPAARPGYDGPHCRRLAVLPTDELVPLASRYREHSRALATLLDAVAPARRANLYDRALSEVDTAMLIPAAEIMEVLPAAVRIREARRVLGLAKIQEREAEVRLWSAYLAWPDASAALDVALRSGDARCDGAREWPPYNRGKAERQAEIPAPV
ncbi:hypothetical protein [Micromonospora oryzae]|uniref:hypothetical protein n=1 Tax=Micromonospora sp. DSM 102119 TaxID=3111768 RepID=UPI0031D8BC62